MSNLMASSTPKQAFSAAFTQLKPHRIKLFGVVLCGVLVAVAGLVGPWAVGGLVDKLLATPSMRDVVVFALLIVAGGVVSSLGTWWGSALMARALEPAIAGLREDVLRTAVSLDANTIETAERGDVISRIADDSREVSTAASTVVPLMVQAGFTVVISAFGMAAVDWRLGLVGLVAIPLYWTTLRVYLPRSGPLYTREREAFGVRTQRLVGAVEGAETLRAFRAEDTELKRIDAASGEARDISISVFRFLTWAFSRNNRAECITLVLILGTGFYLVNIDLVTVGAVSTAALIFHRLFGPIGTLVGMFSDIQSASASLIRMVGVINAASNQVSGTSPAPASTALTLFDVSHHYHTAPVIKNASVQLEPGEHIAIVGATGAGKSTLALIAAGLLTPTSGQVALGGSSFSNVEPEALRQKIAMVSQEIHCFRGSVLDNLRIARPEATDAEVHAVLVEIGDAWLERLPQGIDTIVGDGAFRLTSVENQIMALARVHLADPAIVILDEATAESGSDHAKQLEDAALKVTENRSAIIVAHRLNQAKTADRIIVMDSGEIIESGTHEELRAIGGRYEQLWTAWSAR
ncbi:ABC transporter ATP-binding protein [Corynebacterium glutamicum]|uniref:ABC transporter ATP-binding protein n=1 Tax=Corynebacterium glutamicum TaxID=1718 RepID=UPI000942DA3F|nr:ABC transporter ATP-binding protein [Corynebacterium glutamicum]OKX86286.1 ABC transporter permease [Corynebacterium glutamicum]QDX75169.1 ABC transporter permease [Corynebacterium glutamicum]QDX77933.1 ABC transporter permease [Corynebacterium glutamicum]TWS35180.1 ABC transporter permease [Corynebacterium glutamicum]TWS35449.1 ABC transporter permease [Corynebacterium glutamicum]